MNIKEFYDCLLKWMDNDRVLTIPYEPSAEPLFPLMSSLHAYELRVSGCSLSLRPAEDPLELLIQGRIKAGALNLGREMDCLIAVSPQADEKLRYSFSCSLEGKMTFSDFFGEIPALVVSPDFSYSTSEQAIGGIIAEKLSLISGTEAAYAAHPFTVSGVAAFPASDWQKYGPLFGGMSGLAFRGRMSIWPAPFSQGMAQFTLKFNLLGKLEHFPNLLQKPYQVSLPENTSDVALNLYLYSGLEDEGLLPTSVSRAELGLSVRVPPIASPFDFRVGMFGPDNLWRLNAHWSNGLSIADAVNFFAALFRTGSSGESLLLPSGCALNAVKLYDMSLRLTKDKSRFAFSLQEIRVLISLGEQWKLPLPGVTIDALDLSWQYQFGRADSELPYLFSGEIGAQLKAELSKERELIFSGHAYLPELTIQASFKLRKKAPLCDLLGETAAARLPDGAISLPLFEMEVEASQKRRALSLYAQVEDLLSFSLGDVRIELKQLFAGADFTQQGNNYRFGGVIAFDPAVEDDVEPFEVTLTGRYENGEWLFDGSLSRGSVNILGLAAAFLKIRGSGSYPNLLLEDFQIRYLYSREQKKNELFLRAAFRGSWGEILSGISVNTGGGVEVYTVDGVNRISAFLDFQVGVFSVFVQLDDFTGEQPAYILQLGFQEHYLRASYAVENGKQVLTVGLKNLTLGDLVAYIVSLINPNIKYGLPSPWNFLNQIDLSRITLKLNLTDDIVEFRYHAGINILNFIEIEDVGFVYEGKKRAADGGSLSMLVSTGNETYIWDAINENPPAIADNQTSFRLSYLGLAQHFSTPGIKEAGSIVEAMDALEKELSQREPAYDDSANWLFGADFTINQALRIRIVLNDPSIYGVLITIEAKKGALEKFTGLELELLYKKITKDLGMFKGTLMVPERMRRLDLGGVSVTIGLISLEIYTDGGFLIDLGFPHNMDFSRSFGLEFGPYCGHGGIYFGILSEAACPTLPQTELGVFNSVVKLGLGLSVGIGRSFDLGIVAAGVALEVVGVFEGIFALFQGHNGSESLYYKASAVIGLVGRLYLKVDLKILVIDASAELRAFAMVRFEAYRDTVFGIDLYLRIQASIKILFIRIHFDFTFSTRLEFSIENGAGPAPWESAPPRRRLKERTLFVDSLIAENPWEIELSVCPHCSVGDEGEDCVAFVPVLQEKPYLRWISMMAEWMLYTFREAGEVTAEEAQEYFTEEQLNREITYELLDRFLQENARFHFADPKFVCETDVREESEGMVFPMPPPCGLIFGADGEEKFRVSYWEDNRFPASYAETIENYFKSFNPENGESMRWTGLGEELIPLAETVFTDYAVMILRQLFRQARSLFETFPTDGESLRWETLWDTYGLEPKTVLLENSSLKLKPVRFSVRDKRVLAGEPSSPAAIAGRLGIEAETVFQRNEDRPSLLRQGLELEIKKRAAYSELSQKCTAALMFSRWKEFELKGYYPDYVEDIFSQIETLENALGRAATLEWEDSGEAHLLLALPLEGKTSSYVTRNGDTVIRIAKMCALTNLSEGECPQWDVFCRQVVPTGDGGFLLPDTIVRIDGDETPGRLKRRLFPDGEALFEGSPLLSGAIYRPLAEVLAGEVFYQPDEGESLSGVMSRFEITAEEMSASFCSEKSPAIMRGETVALRHAKRHALGTLAAQLMSPDNGKQLGAAASRFLMSGLRLPAEEKTEGFFRLLRQQTGLTSENRSGTLHVFAGQSACRWLSGDSTILLTDELLQELRPKRQSYEALSDRMLEVRETKLFMDTPNYYTLNEALRILPAGEEKAKTLCMFPQSLTEVFPRMQNPIFTADGGIIEPECLGLILSVKAEIRETKEGNGTVLNLYGVQPEERPLLEQAFLSGAEGGTFLYCPSALEGLPDALARLPDGSMLIKTNLSKETHLFPEDVRESSGTRFVAAADSGECLKLLWQCSVVGGGGFYLAVSGRVPRNAFDERGGGVIWLLLSKGLPAGLCNCAIMQDTMEHAKTLACHEGEPDNTEFSQKTAAFPAGVYGLEIDRAAPRDGNHMDELFTILSYEVSGTEYGKMAGKTSRPLIPKEGGEEGIWSYSAAIPLYKMAGEGGGQETASSGGLSNPYLALGKEAKIRLTLRDVLGNMHQEITDYPIVPEYNDLVAGLNLWPGLSVTYRIALSPMRPQLELLFRCSKDKSRPKTELLRRSLAQLTYNAMELSLRAPFMEEMKLSQELFERIRSFGLQILSYYEGADDGAPEPIKLSFPMRQDMAGEMVRVTVVLTLSRVGCGSEIDGVRFSSFFVRPDILAGGSGEKNADEPLPLKEFAGRFEAAYPAYKLCRAGAGGSDELCAIRFGGDGLISRLSISKNPVYYALRPLSNAPVSGYAPVRPLREDGTLGEPEQKQFTDIDCDSWAAVFLEDVEKVLSGEVIAGLAKLYTEAAEGLIQAKETLADAVSSLLIPISGESGEEPDPYVRRLFRDMATKSLTKGFSVASAASYRANLQTKEPLRMTVHSGQEDGEDRDDVLLIRAGKLDSVESSFCLFYEAQSPYVTSFKPKLWIQIKELEYGIRKTEDGYESSEWLQFILPMRFGEGQAKGALSKGTFLPAVDIDLSYDTYVPNPLRRCPETPRMLFHGMEDTPVKADTIPMWNYKLLCQCEAAQQDVYRHDIVLDDGEPSLLSRGKDGIFEALCGYMEVRDRLMASLVSGECTAAYLKTFVELVSRCAAAWTEDVRHGLRFFAPALGCNVRLTDGNQLEVSVDEAGRDRWNVTAAAKGAVVPGRVMQYELLVHKLNIYEHNAAIPCFKTIRNQTILVRKDKKSAEVRPEFIYQSGQYALDCFYSAITCSDDLELGSTGGAAPGEEVREALLLLQERLNMKERENRVSLTVWYSYRMGETRYRVELPVAMFPDVPARELAEDKNDIAKTIAAWLKDVKPSSAGKTLIFDLSVSSRSGRRILLNLDRLKIKI